MEYWKDMPWHAGVADKHGKVDVGIEYGVLDRTVGHKPPSWRDDVSGQPYQVNVRDADAHDELRIVMRPGASAKGKVLAVRVLEIDRPRYID